MVEGLTSTATDQGSVPRSGSGSPRRRARTTREIEDLRRRGPRRAPCDARRLPNTRVQRKKILVTLAERPHPFPSRTRKLSSPAPKILRGQPFGKIGRRQDFCVNAAIIGCPTGRRWLRVPCVSGAIGRRPRSAEPLSAGATRVPHAGR